MSELRNYMEVCVADLIDGMLKKMNACGCEHCRLDIMAIALNNLPPKYVVTRKGQLYAKLGALQQQLEVDVASALAQAIVKVGQRPRHE